MLDALRHSPFEPLDSCSLAHLKMKTVFLLALSGGQRHGELHAFIIDGSGVTDSRSSFALIVSCCPRLPVLTIIHRTP